MQVLQKPPNLSVLKRHMSRDWTTVDQSIIHPAFCTKTLTSTPPYYYGDDNAAALPVDEDDNEATLPELCPSPRREARVIDSGPLNAAFENLGGLQVADRIQDLGVADMGPQRMLMTPRPIRGRTVHGEEYETQLSSVSTEYSLPLPLRIKASRVGAEVPTEHHQSQVSAPPNKQNVKAMDIEIMNWPTSSSCDFSDVLAGKVDGLYHPMKAADDPDTINNPPPSARLTTVSFFRLLDNLEKLPPESLVRIDGGVLCDGSSSKLMPRAEFWMNVTQIRSSRQEEAKRSSSPSSIDASGLTRSQNPSSSSNSVINSETTQALEHVPICRTRKQPPVFRTRSPTPPGLWGRKPLSSEARCQSKRSSLESLSSDAAFGASGGSCQVLAEESNDRMFAGHSLANNSDSGTLSTTIRRPPFGTDVQTLQAPDHSERILTWVLHKDTVTGSLALLPEGGVNVPLKRCAGHISAAQARYWLAKQYSHPTPLSFSHTHPFLNSSSCSSPWDSSRTSSCLDGSPSIRNYSSRGRKLRSARGHERLFDASHKWLSTVSEGLSDTHLSAQIDATVGQVSDLTVKDNNTETFNGTAVSEVDTSLANVSRLNDNFSSRLSRPKFAI